MKWSNAGRHVILHLTGILWQERLEMPFIPFIFSTVTVQCLERTNWMHVIWAMWRFCALLIIVSLQHCVSGEQVPKHALSHIFQVSVTITATERMAGAFCLSLVVPTKWSQLQYQLNGPSEHSPGKRHNYHLAASTLRQPSETLSAPVELFNVRGKFTSNNLSHLIEKFLSIDQTPMF